MTYARPELSAADDSLPRLPAWVTARRGETDRDVAFQSGAALGHLHLVGTLPAVPHALWRERLALQAAAACVAVSGRPERDAELRDEMHLLRPGDSPGPGGAVLAQWQKAVRLPVRTPARRLLQALVPERLHAVARPLITGRAGVADPVQAAAEMLATILDHGRRDEVAALILADLALARACGWDHVVPLLAAGLGARDLRRTGDELSLACHRAVVAQAVEATRLAGELARAAHRLQAVAPKLRAKGAEEAVALFLSRDALAPAALTGIMSDRAARRLCDRLVSLGAVRELTGRDSFRLYGV